MSPDQKHTLGVRERALWAATEASYEKAEGFLEKFAGLAVSRGTIHWMACEEGARLMRQDEKRRAAVFERGEDAPCRATAPGYGTGRPTGAWRQRSG